MHPTVSVGSHTLSYTGIGFCPTGVVFLAAYLVGWAPRATEQTPDIQLS